MGEEGGIASASYKGFNVEATGTTEDEILESVSGKPKSEDEKKEERSEAAAKLGKAGGKAAAEKRKAEEKKEAKAEKPKESDKESAEEQKAEKSDAKDHPDAKPEDKSDEDTEEKDSAKSRQDDPRHSAKARVEQATRQAAEARRERDEAIARVAGLEARISAMERGAKPTTAEEPKGDGPKEDERPKIEDFDDWGKYEDAREQWTRRQIIRELQEEKRKEEAVSGVNRQLADAITKFREKVGPVDERFSLEVRKLTPEFQLREGETPTARNWLANELIFSPEHAQALMLHLSGHPDDFQRIAALQTPRDVSRALAKLEAKIEAAAVAPDPEPEEETRSEAEPPPKTVKGSAFVADTDPNPKPGEDFDTWRRRTGKKK